MITVGLTGGIASGKSTVGALLTERHGVPVVDADQVARQVVEPGQPALAAIGESFPETISPDGTLDRAALRHHIAHHPEARLQLQAITHPAIYGAIVVTLEELASRGHPAAAVEAALLVETGGYRRYDALIVVSCSPEEQVLRVMRRDGVSEADARAIRDSQLPLADKEAVADVVIRTDGPLEALPLKVDRAWRTLLETLGCS